MLVSAMQGCLKNKESFPEMKCRKRVPYVRTVVGGKKPGSFVIKEGN
jgi:hypothetical protein